MIKIRDELRGAVEKEGNWGSWGGEVGCTGAGCGIRNMYMENPPIIVLQITEL